MSSCAVFPPTLEKSDDVYLYQGKERVIVSFTTDPSKETLLTTAKAIQFLLSHLPEELSQAQFLVEGLTGEFFVDFFMIADHMLLTTSLYHNKMFIYAYISSLYQEFMIKQKKYSFIPIQDLELLIGQQHSAKYDDVLFKFAVQYAVDDIYFVSVLELLERSNRYFFPKNTSSELFKILIFPEILTFWNYMEFRFGKQMLLEFSKNQYTPEDFHVVFGEKVSDIENSYVKILSNNIQKTSLTNIQDKLTNILGLYMSGTKKSLMSE
ncbi:MAG: hypothetical protein ACRCVW_03320 [Brevinema sp.]